MKSGKRFLVFALTGLIVLSAATSHAQPAAKKKKKKRPQTAAQKADLQAAFSAQAPVEEPPPVKILKRQDWGAKDPVLMMTPHRLKAIMIHHTGIRHNDKPLTEKMRGLQGYSQREDTLADGKKKPVWADVPYHFYIAADGEVAEGRNIGFVGDTNTGYDSTSQILVTLEGNFDVEEPTAQQMQSALKLVTWLAKKYHIPAEKITAHKDAGDTACPGSKLYSRMEEFRSAVNDHQP